MALLKKNYDPAAMAGAVDSTTADLQDILDTSGNELIEFDEIASAVNMIRVGNAATGSNPTLTATGDDTNIGFQLTPTGTAVVLLGNTSTGTIADGAVTINAQRGVITSGAAITTAGTTTAYTFQLVNNKIWTSSVVLFQTADQDGNGFLIPSYTTLGQGSCTVRLVNANNQLASSGSVKVYFTVLN